MSNRTTESIVGCLLGTMVGDALGLPYEGLSSKRIQKLVLLVQDHNFIGGKGAISDETEHICLVAQSLIASKGEETAFINLFAWRLRLWLLGLPAGLCLATFKAITRLWKGVPPNLSGVSSTDNGAVIRSTIIGVCYGAERQKMLSLVKASTRITHDDPKAEYGAIAVAVAAYLAANSSSVSTEEYYQTLQTYLEPEAEEFLNLIKLVCDSVERKETGAMFARSIGNGNSISSYIYVTVPVVLQIWLRYQHDYFGGVREIISLGGDTDTTAAILGGIIGAAVGKAGIPRRWIKHIWDFPRSPKWIEELGFRLAKTCIQDIEQPPLPLAIYLIPVRNLLFMAIIFGHAVRRLFPPY